VTSRTVVRRRFIGRALHHYRQTFGFTVEDVAQLLECDPSKISRIETGQRGIKSEELRGLLEWYGASESEQDMLLAIEESTRGPSRGWWHDYAAVLPGVRMEYAVLEQHAARVLTYAPLTIPDLLQTTDYAEVLASANPELPDNSEADAAKVVQLRQRRLVEIRQPELEVVISEAALRTKVSDETIRQDQLRYIFERASENGWINVRVVRSPAAVQAAQGAGAFSVLRFSTLYALDMIHFDGPGGGLCLDDPPMVAAYVRAFMQAQAAALSPADSLGFIRQLSGR
jgi:transcriptional regulator with XRE-family HTH domain